MKKTGRNRGSMMFMVVIFSLILSITGLAVIYLYGMQEIMARRDLANARALYAAEAGIEKTRIFLWNLCVTQNRLPEEIPNSVLPRIVPADPRSSFHPFYPAVTGETVLQYTPQKETYRVLVNPADDNNVPRTGAPYAGPLPPPEGAIGPIGNYVVVSSATVTSGARGSYDTHKTVRATIRMHQDVPGDRVELRIVDRSWVEEPVFRVVNP
ncbi:MAG: pilus assembly PilX family protein [Endomicrobiales bacterium]